MEPASIFPGNLPVAGEDVLAHLDAVASSPGFVSAPRKIQFLRYLVERALGGQTVTEYAAGVDVFDRPESFNPSEDSIVRTEATRLRQKLREYYATHRDGLRIELPLRSLTPIFISPNPAIDTMAPESAGHPETSGEPRRRAWMLWAAGAVVVVTGLLLAWRAFRFNPETPSVAILPFLNLTGDPSQEYLSDSITDELTEALAETTKLRVVARTSAFQFKGKMQDVREIGRRLNVAAIVEGSVRRSNGQLELIIQVIRTENALHIWSKKFDVADRDIRDVETEIAQSTQRSLLPTTPDSLVVAINTADPEAHDLYLRAVYLFYKADADSLRKSLELARRAVQLDPSYVRAHWLIVKAEQNLTAVGQESSAEAERNSASNLKAVLRLDPASPEAHTQIAFRKYAQQWDWPAAEKEFRLAIDGGRSAPNTLNLYGWSLMTRGRFGEAHALFNTALDIDPLAQAGARLNQPIAWLMERKYASAKRAVDSMLQLNPNAVNAYSLLSWIALAEKDCTSLARIDHRLGELVPGNKLLVKLWWDARCGSSDDARHELARVLENGAKPYLAPYPAAEVYSILNDRDSAVTLLNRAALEKSDMIMYLQIDPLLDPIRNDPRVQALARRIGLPQVKER
jgi:serine/threonine-protein kinase